MSKPSLRYVIPEEEKKMEDPNQEQSEEELMDTIIEAVLSQISECSNDNMRSISISSSNSKES